MDICVLFYWLTLVFCGVLATPSELPRFWIFMYRVSPLTYFLEGLAVAGLYNVRMQCSTVEELHIPLAIESGARNCGEYLSALAQRTGAEVLNPDSSDGDCLLCPISGVNTVLQQFGMTVSPWRDVRLMAAYVCFNIAGTFLVYWLVRTPKKQGRVGKKREMSKCITTVIPSSG
ncbi:hypothetical protein F5B22DRAFT_527160 [Xylaria bambusicola]|uniref:uncharacterized protein n=1 Tax=Xylaria bambusicola TaxID=326684 RepID=UPI002007228E|nr:uncharacterized protein F5B22DRAFT_527160 [Xylaria bambusicola]KAI0505388.1 hypothetical protein F5B22DRAFT_527160 [Xylaria bambusicola]